MKKIFTAVVLLSVLAAKAQIQLIGQTETITELVCTVSDYETSTQGVYTQIHLKEGNPILQKGAPDLEKLTTAVVVDDAAQMQISITHSGYDEYHDIFILPSKGNLLRTVNPSDIPFEFGPEYQNDAFFPGALAKLGRPYIMGHYRGQSVQFFPLQYNPVTHVLRVYHDIQVAITPSTTVGENAITAVSHPVNRFDAERYKSHFLNYSGVADRYQQIDEIGNMLVVTHNSYIDELAPWIQWKKEAGIDVEVVDVATVNSISAIEALVADRYNNGGLSYLMLVGDEDQIPVTLLNNSGGQGYCDACYGYVTGNDSYPEVLVGHFLVHNESELPTIIAKTLEYEKTPYTGTDWFSVAMGIGSNEGDGIGDDNEADWQHQNGIKDDLLGFTYTEVWEKYDGDHSADSPSGGATADGTNNPSANSLSTVINGGCSLINYTGHGAHTLIVTGSYSNTNINQLNNTGMYPFFIVVGCCTGDYDDDDDTGDTFGEAWQKTPGTALTGGIGGAFSSVYQSWAPPMEGQDEMNKLVANIGGVQTRHTLGSIHWHGCMGMNDVYGTQGDEMTDTWILMADPSVQLRTAMPGTLVVSHANGGVLGMSSLAVTCPTEDAFVAITMNGEILGTALISGGVANVSFPAVSVPGQLVVTVTAFNMIPYQGTVDIVPANGPYLTGAINTIIDATGNNDGMAGYNENITMTLLVTNVGTEASGNVIAVLSSTSSDVIIDDNEASFNAVAAGADVIIDDAFDFHFAPGVADQTVIAFTVVFTDSQGNSWTSNASVVVQAPALECGEITITEISGNGNGRPDAGEQLEVTVNFTNTGHAATQASSGSLQTGSSSASVVSPVVTIAPLAPNSEDNFSFTVNIDGNATATQTVSLDFIMDMAYYGITCSDMIQLNLNMEDWESGTDSTYDWQYGGNADWFVQTQTVYEGQYAQESGNIGNSQSTSLELTVEYPGAATVEFMYKVSSEEGWDYLRFYVDNQMQDEWSGEVDWTLASYPVTAGTHAFRWEYAKDEFVASGSDAAWVDNIILPGMVTSSVHNSVAAQGFELYPNPCRDVINIRAAYGGVCKYSITDVSGRLIESSSYISLPAQLSIQHLPDGIYQLTMDYDGLVKTCSFLKQSN